MIDYSKGKIYKIVNDSLDLVYYGSTCNELRKRLYNHKSHAKANRKCSSRILFESGEAKIFLVEQFPTVSKMLLLRRERWYIENNDCVNKLLPGRTEEERPRQPKKTQNRIVYSYHVVALLLYCISSSV